MPQFHKTPRINFGEVASRTYKESLIEDRLSKIEETVFSKGFFNKIPVLI